MATIRFTLKQTTTNQFINSPIGFSLIKRDRLGEDSEERQRAISQSVALFSRNSCYTSRSCYRWSSNPFFVCEDDRFVIACKQAPEWDIGRRQKLSTERGKKKGREPVDILLIPPSRLLVMNL